MRAGATRHGAGIAADFAHGSLVAADVLSSGHKHGVAVAGAGHGDGGFYDGAVFHDDADGDDLSVAALVFCGLGAALSCRLHLQPSGHARQHVDSSGGDDRGPHSVLLHADSHAHSAGGIHTHDCFSWFDCLASHGIAVMVGLWLAITLVIGKGWCSYACFFGGIEEGVAAIPKRAQIRKIDPRWRYGPWAVLLAMVLLSFALFEPAYCMWLCPFKTVTEYVAARNAVGLVQNAIFILLFVGLVVVLPYLTKKRTQCSFFCPFGAFQSIFNKTSIFDIRIDRARCKSCKVCQNACPNLSLSQESIARGETLMSCMKCGACVDVCTNQAAVWHIKGTDVAVKPERARLMFLYAAWAMAVMFGGSIIAQGIATILHFVA